MKQGWERKKLGDVAKVIYGYTEKASFTEIGPKFLRITDIQNDGVNWETVPFCRIDDADFQKYKLSNGDIVFARTGATTGKSYLVNNPPKSVFASYLIKVHINYKGLWPEYLFLFFQTKTYWDAINEGISGSAQGGFNASKLSELKIPLPQIDEQQRIVAILNEVFSTIDQAKENIKRNLQNAKELFLSEQKRLFDNEGKDWEKKKLYEISENLDSRRVPVTKSVRNKGEIPYYGASGVVDYVSDYLFDEDLLCISEDGANLLARTYPIAFSITGKSWVNNHAHVLRFNNICSQKFVELYLNSIKLDDFVSGMAQPKLNQTMLNRISIPFPPMKVQQTIVEKLESFSNEIEQIEEHYQNKLNYLEDLKKSILQKAFTGELTQTAEIVA